MTDTMRCDCRITVRQLEALVRLSEALARLRCTEKITPTYVREVGSVCNLPLTLPPCLHAVNWNWKPQCHACLLTTGDLLAGLLMPASVVFAISKTTLARSVFVSLRASAKEVWLPYADLQSEVQIRKGCGVHVMLYVIMISDAPMVPPLLCTHDLPDFTPPCRHDGL